MIKVFMATIALLLYGCVSGPKFDSVGKAPNEMALIYVYRPSRFGGAVRSPDLYANSTKMGAVRNGGYFKSEMPPGATVLTFGKPAGARDLARGIHVDLVAGQTYFLRVDFSVPGFDKPTRPDGTTAKGSCGFSGIPAFKLLTSSEEMSKLVASMDTRVQNEVCSPGVMFVTGTFAAEEIKDTKLSQ